MSWIPPAGVQRASKQVQGAPHAIPLQYYNCCSYRDRYSAAVSEKLDAVTGSVTALLDQGLAAASDTVRSSTAAVSTEANKAAAQAKVGWIVMQRCRCARLSYGGSPVALDLHRV